LGAFLRPARARKRAFGAPAAQPAGAETRDATADTGVLRFVVFSALSAADPVPKRGVEVIITGAGCKTTNADGTVVFHLLAGTHRLQIVAGEHTVERLISVMPDHVIEVLVTVRPHGRVTFQIETPGKKVMRSKRRREAVKRKKKHPLSGRVINRKDSTPVAGARIFSRTAAGEARSGPDGRFVIRLPRGTHDLTVIHPRFGTTRIRAVHVPVALEKRSEPVVAHMTPIAVRLDDFTVSAPRIVGNTATLMMARKKSRMVTDVIGAEQMAKQGAGDAAAALKRVTGITVIGGKYVYVRGLGERYSSTTLNGSTLPSPEPERRVVPLDMFPASLLESVVIQKNYSPDLPGAFGGGVVKLQTRGFPARFTATLSLSGGVLLSSTFQRGLFAKGGRLDVLGIDDGTRALPGPVDRASADSPLMERDAFSTRGYTADALERFGELMPNHWNLHRKRVWPDVGLSASIGSSFKLWGKKAGFLAALTYDNDWVLQKRKLSYYVMGEGERLEPAHSYDVEKLQNNITLAGILTFGVDLSADHKLRVTSLFDRITDDEARVFEGYNRDVGTRIRVTRIRWVERMLHLHQLRGAHRLGTKWDLELDWRYTFSMANRDEPDRREVRFDQEPNSPDLWLLSDRPEGNQRLFSELVDHNHDLGADLKMKVKKWSWLDVKLKSGFNLVSKRRNVSTRRFKFKHKGPLSGDADIISASPEEIFVPAHIGSDGFQFEEITRQTDNYDAAQTIWALYAMADWTLPQAFNVTAGLRLEGSLQRVRTFELFNPENEPIISRLNTVDALPVVGVSWKPKKSMVLRAFYGRTVSRPDFRELSPATFNDVTGGRQIYGNPDLKRALLDNLDLRFEWYPSRGESISLALFYKHFKNPIESIVIVSAQHSVTYENAEGANNMGAEISARKRLGFIHPRLRDFYLAGNAAVIWSRVELPKDSGIQTSDARPLQGQSPYVINVQLGYDDVDRKTTVAVMYNICGARIREVGALGAPDIVERPFHRLDVVFRQGLAHGFTLKLKAKNLIDRPVRYTQGGKETERYVLGRAFTVGLSKKW
jgi:outer membrane receptor protein involved in Fe transport